MDGLFSLIRRFSYIHVPATVSNHGVSPDVIEKHFVEGRKFFALPQEEKSKLQLVSLSLDALLHTYNIDSVFEEPFGRIVSASPFA